MSIEYKRVNWQNNITLVNETNLNNMDIGIEQAIDLSNNNQEKILTLEKDLVNINDRLSVLGKSLEDQKDRLELVLENISNVESRVAHIEKNAFSNDLSNLPTIKEYSNTSYMYVDDGGVPSKVNINDIGGGNLSVEDIDGNINTNIVKFKEFD